MNFRDSSITKYCDLAIPHVEEIMKDHNVGGHSIEHFNEVLKHTIKALEYEDLIIATKQCVALAAYLHDIDDPKIFHHDDNRNAIMIISKITSDDTRKVITDTVIEMINLVSASKNRSSDPPKKWMVIPRDCDRLTAIGQEGIDRMLEFAKTVNSEMILPNTLRAETPEQLWEIATPERFASYRGGSASVIDHYYDKLLHIGKPENLKSQNPYILEEAARRRDILVDYVINYWKSQK